MILNIFILILSIKIIAGWNGKPPDGWVPGPGKRIWCLREGPKPPFPPIPPVEFGPFRPIPPVKCGPFRPKGPPIPPVEKVIRGKRKVGGPSRPGPIGPCFPKGPVKPKGDKRIRWLPCSFDSCVVR